MRIAYLGNFVPAHSTENDVKVALESLGVEVVAVQENVLSDWRLLGMDIDRFAFVLWTTTHSHDVDNDHCRRVLDHVRKAGKLVVGYHLDRWWGLAREDRVRTHPFFTHTDLVCTPDGDHDAEWEKLGIRHEWFPPAVSARHVGLVAPDRDRFPHPVVFVGSWRNYHEEHGWRFQMVDALRHRYGKRGSSEFGIYPVGGDRLVGADLATLYATAEVVVGDSCLVETGGRYWSDRIPETLGRGGILAHPHIDEGAGLTGLLWDYTSGNVDSLFRAIDTARELSAADRTWLRLSGVEAIGQAHTYEHRMARLLELLEAPPTGRQRRFSAGATATFLPREGTTDEVVLDEMWRENVYRLDPSWVEDAVVVDIGANIGAVTVWAAKHGARRVVAVEPHPTNLEALARNLEVNGCDSVTVAPWAVYGSAGYEPRVAMLTGEGGGARVLAWSDERDADDDGWWAEGRSLDDVFVLVDQVEDRASQGNPEESGGDVDLLKIDIEGGEWPVLLNEENVALIGARVRRMVVEFHNFGDGFSVAAFGDVVAALAEVGKVEILGRPSTGGTIWWESYK